MSVPAVNDKSESRRNQKHWTFSLWGLMELMVYVAVAVATGKNAVASILNTVRTYDELGINPIWSWGSMAGSVAADFAAMLLAPVSALIALSLLKQAYSLFWAGRRRRFRSIDERFGWHFNWTGRVVLAALVAGCVAIDDVFTPAQFGLDMPEELLWPEAAKALRRSIIVVGLLAALRWDAPPAAKPSRVMRRWPELVVLCAAAFLALLVWYDASLIHRLVLISVHGIEAAQPLKFSDPTIPRFASQRIGIYHDRAALATAAAVGCSLLCAWQIYPSTGRRGLRVIVWAMLAVGWAAQFEFLSWAARHGAQLISPAWNVDTPIGEPHVRTTALLLLMLVSAAVAYRASRVVVEVSSSKPGGHYLHQGRLVLVLLTVAAVGLNLPLFLTEYLSNENCLWLALLIACLNRWWRLWTGRKAPAGKESEYALPPARFLWNWFAVAVTMLAAAPTLALFNFVFWLGPPVWWRVFEPEF